MLTFAGSLARKKRGGYRLSCRQSGGVVCYDCSHHPGAPGIPVALNIRKAGHSLDHRIIGPLVGIGPLGPIASDRYVDYVASNRSYYFFAETYPLSDSGTEVMNEYLCSSYQPLKDLETIF